MMEPMDISNYHVELSKVAGSKDMLAMTRLLAAELMVNPYKTVGEFFTEISDTDLQMLIDIIETHGTSVHAGDLLLMSQMLNSAEGLGTKFDDYDGITKRMNAFGMFAIITSLDRKGLVKVHYENMSFGEDMGSKIVVERIEPLA